MSTTEDLRKIAILIYKIMMIQTYQLLWVTCLKFFMGQLIMPSKTQPSYWTSLPIWPEDVKAIVLSTNIDKANEHECCLKFVDGHLRELEHQLKQYQTQLNIKANHLQSYTVLTQKTMETYIEQHLHCIRIEIEPKVELVVYDYHIQA